LAYAGGCKKASGEKASSQRASRQKASCQIAAQDKSVKITAKPMDSCRNSGFSNNVTKI
jgi:hypothetical protein